jgi:hypothetical protein
MNAGGMAKTCKSNEHTDWVTERYVSGERVRNRQVTYPELQNSVPKGAVILDDMLCVMQGIKDLSVWERPVSYQLVGEVMAHQGDDG